MKRATAPVNSVLNRCSQLAEQSAKSAVDTRELIEGALKEIEQGNSAALNAQESLKLVVDAVTCTMM